MRARAKALLPVVLGLAACGVPVAGPEDAGTLDARVVDAAGDACALCAPEDVDFIRAMADPLAPARRLPGRVFLRSSRQPEPQSGMRNADYANFVRLEEGRGVMAEEIGPGVITRIWLTYGPMSAGPIDDVPVRLVVDGVPVALDGLVDVPLGRLASGDVPGFPAPWVMDPSLASGGLVLSVPIHYAESVRLELSHAEGAWAYYQIDGRSLPSFARVSSFTATPTAEHLAALDAARELWVDHAHPGDDRVLAPQALAPGASLDTTIDGPAVITTLEVPSDPTVRARLRVLVEIDGEVAVDAPLAWLTGSSFPAGSYSAGLTASSPLAATLYAPLPVRVSAHIRLTNDADAETSVGLRTRVLAQSIPADVGSFRAECSSATVVASTEVTEPQTTLTYPNVVLGESLRGPGQYVGLTTFQTAPGPWWFALEPDHEVAIDGVYELLGTGTEDYFAGAFYFMNGPYASVTSGASGWNRDTDPAETHLYRHHLVDTWPFDRELRFELESYIDGTRFDGCIFTYLFSSGP